MTLLKEKQDTSIHLLLLQAKYLSKKKNYKPNKSRSVIYTPYIWNYYDILYIYARKRKEFSVFVCGV